LTIRNRAQGFSGCAPLVTYRVVMWCVID